MLRLVFGVRIVAVVGEGEAVFARIVLRPYMTVNRMIGGNIFLSKISFFPKERFCIMPCSSFFFLV